MKAKPGTVPLSIIYNLSSMSVPLSLRPISSYTVYCLISLKVHSHFLKRQTTKTTLVTLLCYIFSYGYIHFTAYCMYHLHQQGNGVMDLLLVKECRTLAGLSLCVFTGLQRNYHCIHLEWFSNKSFSEPPINTSTDTAVALKYTHN